MGNNLTKQVSVAKVFLGFLSLLLFLLIVSSLFPLSGNRFKTNAKIAETRLEEQDAAAALKAYSIAYTNFLFGDAESVEHILSGEDLFGKNPQKVVFLNYRRSVQHLNEMVDPWETPYKIEFFQQTNFVIRSAGKDSIFSNADDIIFNSVSNDFVNP